MGLVVALCGLSGCFFGRWVTNDPVVVKLAHEKTGKVTKIEDRFRAEISSREPHLLMVNGVRHKQCLQRVRKVVQRVTFWDCGGCNENFPVLGWFFGIGGALGAISAGPLYGYHSIKDKNWSDFAGGMGFLLATASVACFGFGFMVLHEILKARKRVKKPKYGNPETWNLDNMVPCGTEPVAFTHVRARLSLMTAYDAPHDRAPGWTPHEVELRTDRSGRAYLNLAEVLASRWGAGIGSRIQLSWRSGQLTRIHNQLIDFSMDRLLRANAPVVPVIGQHRTLVLLIGGPDHPPLLRIPLRCHKPMRVTMRLTASNDNLADAFWRGPAPSSGSAATLLQKLPLSVRCSAASDAILQLLGRPCCVDSVHLAIEAESP